MNFCPACGHEWEGPAPSCPACGTLISPDDVSTVLAEKPAEEGYSETRPFPGNVREDAGDDLRLGSLFASRYRIETLLGRGGMGVVYRAQDETLGVTVALKFLPPKFLGNKNRVNRFLGEVRHAREIAHPNVCRVYDVGESEGRLFLSMEYIDGEDLASLLRRIGRLPQEKAVDIAAQLCDGLASLHGNGMLHRDLKPANVMLDGRGQVRLTDFGLTAIAEGIKGSDIKSGTPRYMSPEQLDGREVTVRSDIYSLGLVLYEVFTGRPAFEADSFEDYRRIHLEEQATAIAEVVSDVDPSVERLVSRCIEKDPARRPADAATVRLALPGGDPLAAALALGDTPSPEVVAGAGGGRLQPWLASLLLLAALSGLWIESAGKGARSIVDHLDVRRAPAAQEERARAVLAGLGISDQPVDAAGSYQARRDVLRWFEGTEGRNWTALEQLWPSPLIYWYRQESIWLQPANGQRLVTRTDPPPGGPGSVEVVLSHRGELQSLQIVPGRTRKASDDEQSALIAFAGLDPQALQPTERTWTPLAFADRTWILTGADPRGSAIDLKFASIDGRITEFHVAGPWDRPEAAIQNRAESAGVLVVLLTVLGLGAMMSVQNLRDQRVDPWSAGRVAVVVLTLPILAWLIRGHHPPLAQSLLAGFLQAFAWGALFAVFTVTLYFAAEPVVRRVWPQMLISWTRATTGGFTGPTVGAALLAGGAGFALSVWINQLTGAIRLFTSRAPLPAEVSWHAVGSTGGVLGVLADQIPLQLFAALLYTMVLVLLRMLTRSRVIAGIGFVLIVGGTIAATTAGREFGITTALLTAMLWLGLLLRAGLLALVTAKILSGTFLLFPVTVDTSQIHAPPSLALLGLVVAVLLWAMFQSVGTRSRT
jgi:serine/threonine-protein kinase